LIEASPENARRILTVLDKFGFGSFILALIFFIFAHNIQRIFQI